MYSLLIMNQKTMESFHNFRPLFIGSLEKGKIGYCRWNESGLTIDQAVPELREKTNDKKEWRAIIVRLYDETGMKQYKSVPENPYDFLINADYSSDKPQELESKIPLVHLTHLLGGIPSPEINFELKVKEDDPNKLPYTYYAVKKDEEAEKLYLQLREKYEYNGILPSEIWIITLREKVYCDENTLLKRVWTNNDEMKSSDFCRRNRYPSRCRFMVYNYEKNGPVQRDAALFNLWVSIRLLADNYVEPSVLQAYRLYSISSELNLAKLDQFLESNLDRIEGMKKNIGNQIERTIDENKNHPHKRTLDSLQTDEKDNLDVTLDIKNVKVSGINSKLFTLYAKTEREEMDNWRSMNSKTKEEIRTLIKTAERGLNTKADLLRQKKHVDRDIVRPLDRFEMEDVDLKLSQTYDDILQKQKILPDTTVIETEEEKKQAEDITYLIRTRISNSRAFGVALNVVFVVTMACIPLFVLFIAQKNLGRLMNLLFIMLCTMLVFSLTMLVVLIWNKIRLKLKIDKYNWLLYERIGVIKVNEKEYSKFVKNICFYSRGKDYIRVMYEQQNEKDDRLILLETHRTAVENFKGLVEKLGKAFLLDIKGTESSWRQSFLNINIPPFNNVAYSFETDEEYEVRVNSSCGQLVSPFEFVERMNICREELYDDAASNA